MIDLKHVTTSFSGFYVQPGTETLVSMQVTGNKATDEAIKFFPPDRRNCYTDEEFQPLYFNKVRKATAIIQ